MSKKRKEDWDEKYREGRGGTEEPSRLLKKWISDLPLGKALDVGCGTGRNSIFLSENGYSVDAIDFSEEAIRIAKRKAEEKNQKINWIRKDIMEHDFPEETYDVITIAFFHPLEKLEEIKNSLKNNGYILYTHHINTRNDMDRGPKNLKFRFEPNELLEVFKDFQTLEYAEGTETHEKEGKSAIVKIVSRNTQDFEKNLPAIRR